jgi:hypothetical protein
MSGEATLFGAADRVPLFSAVTARRGAVRGVACRSSQDTGSLLFLLLLSAAPYPNPPATYPLFLPFPSREGRAYPRFAV